MAANPTITVAMVYGGFSPETVRSLLVMQQYDATHRRLLSHTNPFLFVGGNNIASQRNTAVRLFLDDTTSDWLLFVDTDESWDPDLLERLVDSADPDTRPLVSGLIMARREHNMPISPACVVFDDADPPRPVRPSSIPHVKHWPVAGVGAGCLLVHRRVLTAMREKFADHEPREWFEYQRYSWFRDDGTEVKDEMGEDYVFSLRAAACGVTPIVDTTIGLGHLKTFELTREMFHSQAPQPQTYVVIPVKDRLDLTRPLVEALREQGGYDALLIFDNGSGAETKQWLNDQPDVLVFNAKGCGIHDMWNAGTEYALATSGGVGNVIFLNNDIKISDRFCEGLVDALRSGPWAAVSPNYDGREITETQQVRGICAERYDGTGGLAGFAFAVRLELFAQGYKFPTDAKWWFGDNDLTCTLDSSGLAYGIVPDVACEHLGAGTAGDWQAKKWSKQLAADREAFMAKWGVPA